MRNILESLDQLPKNKDYDQSVALIRKIVSMMLNKDCSFTPKVEDSCLKNGSTLTAHGISV